MKQTPTMNERMADWIRRASSASNFLRRLYLELKDPIQRERAAAAGAFAREKCRTLRSPVLPFPAPWIGKSGPASERIAWQTLIESLLGMTTLVALGVGSTSSKASPLHRRLDQELKSALQGFSTAFPDDTVEQDLDHICSKVIHSASEIAEQAWMDVRRPSEAQVNVREFLQQEWTQSIRPGLLAFVREHAGPTRIKCDVPTL